MIREQVTRDEAEKRIAAINEPYKMEILESIKEEPITIYHIGKVSAFVLLKCDYTFQTLIWRKASPTRSLYMQLGLDH